MMQMISAGALGILAALCVMAVFSEAFLDNWLQFLGLCGVALWAIARFVDIVKGTAYLSSQQVFSYVGLAAYALGTAQKVLLWRKFSKVLGLSGGSNG